MKTIIAYATLSSIRASLFVCGLNLYVLWATQTAVKLPFALPLTYPIIPFIS